MNLIKWKPNSLTGWDFDSVFDNIFGGDNFGFGRNYPAVDVREEKDKYVMEAELPGLTENDIDVNLDDNMLTISSRKSEEKKEEKDGYLLRERRAYSFKRSFIVPKDVDRNKIDANFKDGLLTLTLEKAPEAKPKKIEVKNK
jgi:HSP20 family molecular chaperone IbpA